MSVYNGHRYLRSSVESILGQSFTNFEFIIVDDGSSDSTGAILREYARRDKRIDLLQNPANIGLTRSLNRILPLAKGDYIARQDADDLSLPNRFEEQIAVLRDSPEAGFVGSSVTEIDEYGTSGAIVEAPTNDTLIRWQMLFRNVFKHPSAMIRRRVLKKYGFTYDERFRYAQDYDLWSRLLVHCVGLNIANPLVQSRTHSGQITKKVSKEQEACAVEISRSNIERIGIRLSVEQVRKLCRWSQQPASDMSPADMRLCCRYFDILAAFERRTTNADPKALGQIRRHLIGHLFSVIPISKANDLVSSGLLKSMAHNGLPTLCREILLRVAHFFEPEKPQSFSSN